MFTPDQLNQVSALISEAQSYIIIFPKQASFDVQVAASAVAHSILSFGNKEVYVVTPSLEKTDTSIFHSLEVREELGNKTLQISFPYQAEKVDKVSYNIDDENKRFYLSIQPQKGEKPLDYHALEYAYVGADTDLIILVGVGSYDSLDQLYFGYEDMFKDTRVISLNTFETTMGTVKLNSSGMSSLSEAVTMLVRSLSLPIPGESATQLLSGIEQSTKNFSSYTATADTFESVGFLLRQGARRIKKGNSLSVTTAAHLANTASTTQHANTTHPASAPSSSSDGTTSVEYESGHYSGFMQPVSAQSVQSYSQSQQISQEVLESQPQPQQQTQTHETVKKKSRSKNGKATTLNEDKVAEGKIKPVGTLHYQPTESSMGARG